MVEPQILPVLGAGSGGTSNDDLPSEDGFIIWNRGTSGRSFKFTDG